MSPQHVPKGTEMYLNCTQNKQHITNNCKTNAKQMHKMRELQHKYNNDNKIQ